MLAFGLSVVAEAMDLAAVLFGGAAGGGWLEEQAGFALFGDEGARGSAGFGFMVEGLGDGGGSADFAEGEDFDFEFSTFIFDGELVADTDFVSRARGLLVRLDAAEIAGLRCEGAGFEEARGPEPFVDAHV